MTPDYYREVSSAYLRLVGRGLTLSPRDRELVSRWWRAQVPAPVVVQGIENAFAHVGAKKVRSLAFALAAVDDAIQSWQSRRAGSRESYNPNSEDDWQDAFEVLLRRLSACQASTSDRQIHDVFQTAIDGVTAILSGSQRHNHFPVVEAMEKLEDEVCAQGLNAMAPGERIRLEKELDEILQKERNLSPVVQEDTRKALMRKRVRKTLKMPPFDIQLGGGWS